MVTVLRPLTFLLIAATVMMLGNGVLTTVLGIRLELEAYPEYIIGFIMSAYSIGLIIGTRFCPRIIRRVGHIRAFAVFASTATTCILIHAIWVDAVVWIVLRVITGLSLTGLYMIIESWLNERSSNQNRGRIFSIYQICSFAGLAFSQLLLLYFTPEAFQIYVIIAIFFVTSLIPVSLTKTEHPEPLRYQSYGIMHLFKDAPLAVLGCLGAGIINNIFYTLLPVLATQKDMDLSQVAILMSFTIICGFLWQWPIGAWSDRYDRTKVLFMLFLVIMISALLWPIGFSDGQLFWLWPLCGLNAIMFTLYTISVAHAHDHVSPENATPVSASLIMTYGVGAFSGPLLASVSMSLFGSNAMFMTVTTASAIFCILTLIYRKDSKTHLDDQEPFVPAGPTTPVITELDPRASEESA